MKKLVSVLIVLHCFCAKYDKFDSDGFTVYTIYYNSVIDSYKVCGSSDDCTYNYKTKVDADKYIERTKQLEKDLRLLREAKELNRKSDTYKWDKVSSR